MRGSTVSTINLEALSKELKQIQAVLRKILNFLDSSGSSGALATFKSIPSNCLSCGRGDSKYAPLLPHVKGRDGRLYRADDRISQANAEDHHFSIGADVFLMDTPSGT
jgi:hypothetical protein